MKATSVLFAVVMVVSVAAAPKDVIEDSGQRGVSWSGQEVSGSEDGVVNYRPMMPRFSPSALSSEESSESIENLQEEISAVREPLFNSYSNRRQTFSSALQVLPTDDQERPTSFRERRTFRPIVFPDQDPPSFPREALSASYVVGRVDGDAETIPFEGGHPPPDLSRDTAVNYPTNGQQGLVMIDPDAEVFDLNSVVAEAHSLEFD